MESTTLLRAEQPSGSRTRRGVGGLCIETRRRYCWITRVTRLGSKQTRSVFWSTWMSGYGGASPDEPDAGVGLSARESEEFRGLATKPRTAKQTRCFASAEVVTR